MTAPHAATLTASYDSPDRASCIFDSLEPEIGGVDDDRASADVRRDGDTVEITVEAADLTALRAGTTSWSRLLVVAEQVTVTGAKRF